MTVTNKLSNNPYNALVSVVDIKNSQSGIVSGWDIAIKDNFNLIGTLTTASCRFLENHESIYTATAVTKILEEGAHIVGKTSMDELGMGGTNLTAATGPVRNPHDETRISGGSSGGSAALVGGKKVRAALGSDTGDSVRKPASYCGAVGVKPTYGRISRYGVIPYASSLDHVGYFTQNVSDAAVLLQAMAGRDDKDMTSSFEPVVDYSEFLNMDLKGKRIGFFDSIHETIGDEIFNLILNKLEEALISKGAIIVKKTMNLSLLRALLPVYNIISNAEAVANHANLDGVRYGMSKEGKDLESIMIATRSEGFTTAIKRRFIFGAFSLNDKNQEEIFNKAKKVRKVIVDAYASFFDDVDVMVALATSQIAPKIEGPFMEEDSDRYLVMENHMVINNFTGFPSMTIPLTTLEGMPLGLNLSSKPFTEATLFGYASAIERLVAEKGEF